MRFITKSFLPTSTRKAGKMKPNIAFLHSDWDSSEYRRTHDLYGGLGYYRVIKPAQILSKWFDIEVIGADFQHWGTIDEKYTRLGRDYDLIYSKHFRTGMDASNALGTAKHFKKNLVIDVDDNFIAMRTDNPAFADYEQGNGPGEFLGASLGLASGVTVSTEPLRKLYKTLNKKIDILPNCNDINDWPKDIKKWDDGKIRIGFAGGRGHIADLDLIVEPMSYILLKYPNVLFEIVGSIWPTEAMELVNRMNAFTKKDISKQVRIAGGTLAWQGYPEMMANMGWDIVIAPLVKDAFNECKSHIRWLEATMIKCPVVASPVYPYKEPVQDTQTIQDEKTGLFAKDSKEWFAMLDGLITHPEARKELAENAYNYIKDYWQWEQHAYKFKKVIEKYL